MKERIKDLFSFHRRERRGVLVLVFLLLLELVAIQFIPLLESEQSENSAKLEEAFARFKASRIQDTTITSKREDTSPFQKEGFQPRYIVFNPNEELPDSTWGAMGLKSWQVKNLKNYLAKGGHFKKKSDFRKLYGLTDEQYTSLEPYIDLPDTLPKKQIPVAWEKKDNSKAKEEMEPVELNGADSAQLVSVRGIGPSTARQMIWLRNKLGGFHSLKQIKEIKGMREENYEKIAAQAIIDTTKIKRLNINQADVKQLVRHPYIDINLARVIVAYREKHGPYLSTKDIMQTDLVDGDLYTKLVPYLKVE